jgi:hypothetical protein
MASYLERMPAGIPGEISRWDNVILEPNLLGAVSIPYGAVVKLSAGVIAPIASGDTAAAIYGLLARAYPTQGANGDDAAPAGRIIDVMRSGYMTVTLKGVAAAAKGGTVFVRVTADTGKLVGDIEAAADGAKSVVVPGCIFAGPADSGGNVEISFNI